MECIDVRLTGSGTSLLQAWLPLVGSTIVALATLIGVTITVLKTRKSAIEELSETRRQHQREVVADLVAVSTRLHTAQAINFMAVPFMSATDLMEWVDTDSSKLQRELIVERDRAIIRARIEIRTPTLKSHIDAIAKALNDIEAANKDNARMSDTKRTTGERYAAGEQMKKLHDALHDRVIELREVAVSTLAVDFK